MASPTRSHPRGGESSAVAFCSAYGGGVSELLRSIVPLLNDLGLVAEWQVISGEDDFFKAGARAAV